MTAEHSLMIGSIISIGFETYSIQRQNGLIHRYMCYSGWQETLSMINFNIVAVQ
jgi:hypothetical protein